MNALAQAVEGSTTQVVCVDPAAKYEHILCILENSKWPQHKKVPVTSSVFYFFNLFQAILTFFRRIRFEHSANYSVPDFIEGQFADSSYASELWRHIEVLCQVTSDQDIRNFTQVQREECKIVLSSFVQ